MTHTRGPWKFEVRSNQEWKEIMVTTSRDGEDSTILCSDCGEEELVIAGYAFDVEEIDMPLEEVEANARLIASAPDLLACLENLVNRGLIPDDNDHYEECLNAIANATGREMA
jgi:hypothetical protein